MDDVLIVNKSLGITSFDVIKELKKRYPGEKIGHAGTLDPLASGVLICLVGKDATKRQVEFMDCDKDYEFEVLYGFDTDTYDVLGLVNGTKSYRPPYIFDEMFDHMEAMVGKIDQPVPPFSAVKVNGRELYRWYLDGKIDDVDVPVKSVEIKSLQFLSSVNVTRFELQTRIHKLLATVKSGFRQKMVLEKWDEVLSRKRQTYFLVIKYKATVSKGTYVRAIAHKFGQDTKIGACTLTIKRTRVGKYTLDEKALPI